MTYIIVLLLLVAVLLLYAALRPAGFQIERSAEIHAAPDAVFHLIDDFRNWNVWSPWEKLDPDLHRDFNGSERGPGAVYEWEGNRKVGKGRMEILESHPPRRLAIRLEFMQPFKATNHTEFTLTPQNGNTRVTWRMTGTNNFMARLMGVFINMDKLVGRDFEKGLANLGSVVEQRR